MINTNSSTSKAKTKNIAKYYIGLMSGTSADGIDLALVEFVSDRNNVQAIKPKVAASLYQAYSAEVIEKITSLYNPSKNEIDRAFCLDVELAKLFSKAVKSLLKQEQLTSEDIIAIGNHGQTIRHRPNFKQGFTLQIGCCQTLATLTDIKVIGQFRRKDMALGGQGAPLVPAFHQHIFSESNSDVFVVNIGGIANISFLPKNINNQVIGFDTGPGNALLDDWYQTHHPSSLIKYDQAGKWAKSGQVNQDLLQQFLADDYFDLNPPKSTGREYFNLTWLEHQLADFRIKFSNKLSSEDIQATLVALTAISISENIKLLANKAKVYLCGGGTHNSQLIGMLNQKLNDSLKQSSYQLLSTNENEISGDLLEAVAFAWLAFAYENKISSNLPAVTGASKKCTLGTAFFP